MPNCTAVFYCFHAYAIAIALLQKITCLSSYHGNRYITVYLHLLAHSSRCCPATPDSALVVGIEKKWCSLKAWLWAAGTVCSRTMHVPFCSAGALTPFGDLHNYHPPPPPHYPDIGQSINLPPYLLLVFYSLTASPFARLPTGSEALCTHYPMRKQIHSRHMSLFSVVTAFSIHQMSAFLRHS